MFETMQVRDVVSWNAVMIGHANAKNIAVALELFKKMQKGGVKPDKFSFSCAFQACGSVDIGNDGKLLQNELVEVGKLLHNQLVESGLRMDVVIGGTLLNMYAKHSYLEDARHVFAGLHSQNNVLWGTMIAAYTQHAHYNCGLELVKRMQDESIQPDAGTFPFIFKCCACVGALSLGRVVHNKVLFMNVEAEPAISNAIIDMYGKCWSPREGQKVFSELSNQNVVSWNALIAGYVQNEEASTAIETFERMQQGSIEADKVTILEVLKACSSFGIVLQGRKLHFLVCDHGLEMDVVLGSSLVDLYAKLGLFEDMYAVFRGLPSQDVVACSAMIAGHAQQGHWFLAMSIFEVMLQKGIKPDIVSLASIVKACSQAGLTCECRYLHNEVIKDSLERDVLVGNALMDMYAKCSRLVEARQIFDALPGKSLVSWNTIMTGYAQSDEGFQALEVFELMPQHGLIPNRVSFLSTLKACGSIGSIGHGLLVHDQIIKSSLESDLVVSNSVIDMFANCGCLQEAHSVFDGLSERDVVSWSALIAGYAQHGNLKLAQHYLHDMDQDGLKPVSKTFTSILGACSNAGEVEEGHYYFKLMRKEYGITPSIEHCNCVIDILGRSGRTEDAKKFILTMPLLPNVTTWMSLLTSCRTLGSIEFGRVCFDQANKLNPYNSSAFMIMSKIYADANMWADVHKLEDARKQSFAWKKPGKACLEVDGRVHEFVTRARVLQWAESTSSKLQGWTRLLKERGYLPESDSVLEREVDAVYEEAHL